MKRFNIFLVCILVLGLIGGVLPVSAASQNFYPEDLFGSADLCGQYFHNAAEAGTVYEEIDGEYVMTMPIHTGLNYLYSKEAIPYDSFTVSFDFYIIISPNSHFHEMDFLFGMSGGAKPFHQATLTSESGSLNLRHYTLETDWYQYEEDALFCDVYDTESWQTFSAEITAEDVSIYLNGEYLGTLTDTAGCVGANGYIGLRAGSAGGWKVKNLKVVEGVGSLEPEVTTEPTEEPTEVPTEEPSIQVTEEPTQAPTTEVTETATDENTVAPTQAQKPVAQKDGGFPWWIAVVVAVIVVAACVTIWLIIKKKNK